ncbi:hypothetical protein JQX13_39780 [Archangium violaceum]|uniref:hypothetical protein n=1 Tax=Archangium violaceum TaxID=83451 RepID=UPI00193C00EA|nr:hypothetical protein [Archangium violaceum]QRK06203.1 hypothetical protein JQX13_39780 [Archangium violaceum]
MRATRRSGATRTRGWRARWWRSSNRPSRRTGKRLWIAQAYFTPNEALTALLVERARAGVDVRVLAPGDNMLEEGSLVLQDDEAARRMEAFFLEDLKHAREMKAGQATRD